MRNLVIVSKEKDWVYQTENIEVISAKHYLTEPAYAELRNVRVFNLCRTYKYQSHGYYVSLLAQARGHKVVPSVTTIQDLKSASIIRIISDEIDNMIQQKFAKLRTDKFTLSIYFGHSLSNSYDKLAQKIYGLFPAPLIRAQFLKKKKWKLQDISAIPINEIETEHLPYLEEYGQALFNKKRHDGVKKTLGIYDLAILVNPEDLDPPSNKKAIQGFIEAGESLGFHIEVITKDDYNRLPEFDALFIRETTAVNHYTYRFARRAHAEGLIVIDDPVSIVKCANKVYLSEMLHKARINTPQTLIVHKDNQDKIIDQLKLPCVLKRPDSCFSKGVVKVDSKEELEIALEAFFNYSDLIVCQAYLPTAFDWRIGILNRQPLFACKYFMAKNHWQICNWDADQVKREWGEAQGLPLDTVPEKILKTALRAANLVGDGLYGVDLKEIDDKVYVIEINDNPNLDQGFEDAVLKEKLYQIVMSTFLDRLEQKRADVLLPDVSSTMRSYSLGTVGIKEKEHVEAYVDK